MVARLTLSPSLVSLTSEYGSLLVKSHLNHKSSITRWLTANITYMKLQSVSPVETSVLRRHMGIIIGAPRLVTITESMAKNGKKKPNG